MALPVAAFGDDFSASTVQTPGNPVTVGTTVTYVTTVTNTSGIPFPFATLPAFDQPFLDMFLSLYRSDKAPPNNYASVTPSQGTCSPQATTPPSVRCDFGAMAAGASATYTTTVVAQVSMENRVSVVTCTSVYDCGSIAYTNSDTIVLPNCIVPDVRNRTLPSVKRRLKKHACTLGKVTRKHSRRAKKGRVIRQRPAPGTTLPNNGKVAIVLGKG
ncbi:MAG TPA: PASTA domain-containing protein [Thermoleophilaceae bacterium]|jgi:hypothetical protein